MIRLAIYYTPPQQSPLSKAAAEWLGRTSLSLSYPGRQPAHTITDERFRAIIASPFHYGFHGTIKPPFRLTHGATIDQVADRLKKFAAGYHSFILPPLAVSSMNDFFCLRPTEPCPQLQRLANDTVKYFDEFRMLPDEEELVKRRSAGLTPGQENNLQQWGYPYLMDEFRFHLTLTGKIENAREREIIEDELQKRFSREYLQGLPFAALSLFIEKNKLTYVFYFCSGTRRY